MDGQKKKIITTTEEARKMIQGQASELSRFRDHLDERIAEVRRTLDDLESAHNAVNAALVGTEKLRLGWEEVDSVPAEGPGLRDNY